jgi:hypothetical protein
MNIQCFPYSTMQLLHNCQQELHDLAASRGPDVSQVLLHKSDKVTCIIRGAENDVLVHALSLYHLNRMEFTSWIKCGVNNFKIPLFRSRCLSDFCGVCSNLVPTSSSFSLGRQHFLAGCLSRNDPVDLTFLMSSWMPNA